MGILHLRWCHDLMPVRPWPTALESSKAWQVPRARPLSGWLRERATQRLRERTPLMERGCEDSTPRVTVAHGRSHRGVTGVNCKKRSYHKTRIPVSTTCTRSTSNIVAYAHRPPLVHVRVYNCEPTSNIRDQHIPNIRGPTYEARHAAERSGRPNAPNTNFAHVTTTSDRRSRSQCP